MSGQRPVEERISRWLTESAPDDFPHRVLESTFELTRALPQERPRPAWLPDRLPSRARGPVLLLAAAVLVASAVAATAMVGGWLQRTAAPDLRTRVQSAGILRVAVRASAPQAVVPNIGLSGFDIDVANELANRLGLRVEIVTVSTEAVTRASRQSAWDVGLASLPASSLDPSLVTAGGPYYTWPRFLLVGATSPIADPRGLTGRTICAVDGDLGAAWARDRLGGVAQVVVTTRPTDDACINDLQSGLVDAVVTATIGPADLAVRTQVHSIGQPPDEVRVVAARRADHPDPMLADVDRILEGMARDGTLGQLSRTRFGGVDLSTTVVQGQ
jgi:ABC-type amino acid transport substrate-binding protein